MFLGINGDIHPCKRPRTHTVQCVCLEEVLNCSLIPEIRAIGISFFFCRFSAVSSRKRLFAASSDTNKRKYKGRLEKHHELKSLWTPRGSFHRMVPPLLTSAEKSAASDLFRGGHPGTGAALRGRPQWLPQKMAAQASLKPLPSREASEVFVVLLETERNHARCDSSRLIVPASQIN